MKGRKPLPRSTRELAGNPGHRPLPPEVPSRVVRPKPPRYLSREGKKLWRRLVDDLAAAKLLTNLDVDALELLVQCQLTYHAAARDAMENGPVIWVEVPPTKGELMVNPEAQGRRVPKQNPAFAVMHKMLPQVTRLLTEFGMTPSARARVSMVEGKDDEGAERTTGKGGLSLLRTDAARSKTA